MDDGASTEIHLDAPGGSFPAGPERAARRGRAVLERAGMHPLRAVGASAAPAGEAGARPPQAAPWLLLTACRLASLTGD